MISVSKRKCKNTVAEMFCIERAFAKKTLLAEFNKKIKSQHLEIDAFMKIQYERKNPSSWINDKCVICKMPLKIDPLGAETPDDQMSYSYFFIRFEHKFLRKIYSVKQLKQSYHLSTIENQKFIRICIILLSVFNSYMKNIDNEDLVDSDLTDITQMILWMN